MFSSFLSFQVRFSVMLQYKQNEKRKKTPLLSSLPRRLFRRSSRRLGGLDRGGAQDLELGPEPPELHRERGGGGSRRRQEQEERGEHELEGLVVEKEGPRRGSRRGRERRRRCSRSSSERLFLRGRLRRGPAVLAEARPQLLAVDPVGVPEARQGLGLDGAAQDRDLAVEDDARKGGDPGRYFL